MKILIISKNCNICVYGRVNVLKIIKIISSSLSEQGFARTLHHGCGVSSIPVKAEYLGTFRYSFPCTIRRWRSTFSRTSARTFAVFYSRTFHNTCAIIYAGNFIQSTLIIRMIAFRNSCSISNPWACLEIIVPHAINVALSCINISCSTISCSTICSTIICISCSTISCSTIICISCSTICSTIICISCSTISCSTICSTIICITCSNLGSQENDAQQNKQFGIFFH